jgi:hypothetical protein
MLAVITIMRNISNEPEISTGSAASFASVTTTGDISTKSIVVTDPVAVADYINPVASVGYDAESQRSTLQLGSDQGCGVSVSYASDVRLSSFGTIDLSSFNGATYTDYMRVDPGPGLVRFYKDVRGTGATYTGNVAAVNGVFSGSLAANSPSTVNAATYAVANGDVSLRFTTTNCTVTLPAPATFPGRVLYLNTITANSVTSAGTNVIPLGSNTPGTVILAATAGKCAMLQSNGTNWIVMSAN